MFGSRRRKSVRKKGIIIFFHDLGDSPRAKQSHGKVPKDAASLNKGSEEKRSQKTMIQFSYEDKSSKRGAFGLLALPPLSSQASFFRQK